MMRQGLRRWYIGTSLLFGLLFVTVWLAPWLELLRLPSGWQAWEEWPRLIALGQTSLLLTVLTMAMTFPIGLFLAVGLTRWPVIGHRLLLVCTFLVLLIPLPLISSGWVLFWQAMGWPITLAQPARLLACAAMHAQSALPAFVLMVAFGLRNLEPELEEEASLAGSPWNVFWHVTFPRLRPILGLALGWTALCTWNEITITDMLQLRTFGEEVYTQLMTGEAELARAVAVTLPMTLLLGWLVWRLLQTWRVASLERFTWLRTHYTETHFRGRAVWSLLAWLWFAGPWLIPIGSLVYQAGLVYSPASPPLFQWAMVWQQMSEQAVRQGTGLLAQLGWSLLTGLLCVCIALIAAWLMRHSRWFDQFVWLLAALVAATPGPLLGLGMQTVILQVIQWPGGAWLRMPLYDGPSPCPNIWVGVIRFFPVALAALWWLVRRVPHAWEEAAAMEGASPGQRLYLSYVRPLGMVSMALAVLVAAFALGEISAGKIVSTPGYMPLSHLIFQQMHASADAELASLCLVMMLLVGGLAGLTLGLLRWGRPIQ